VGVGGRARGKPRDPKQGERWARRPKSGKNAESLPERRIGGPTFRAGTPPRERCVGVWTDHSPPPVP